MVKCSLKLRPGDGGLQDGRWWGLRIEARPGILGSGLRERGITGDGSAPDWSLLIAAYIDIHYTLYRYQQQSLGCGDIITDVIAVG